MKSFELLNGDCLQLLKWIESDSIDAIVTDPPYGLAFMGKKWDYDVPSVEIWTECLRVLKPGGHLLAFGGTRTYHRMVVNIEDAGFEIRDQIQWLYGSGFPKSHDVSKGIDNQAGAEREITKPGQKKDTEFSGKFDQASSELRERRDRPATDEAKKWAGWGTALKPANEPICLARKPLEKGLTIAENVMKWGTGALNIDASRIGLDANVNLSAKQKNFDAMGYGGNSETDGVSSYNPQGRWPANVLFDEQAAEVLDEQAGSVSRFFYVAKASKAERNKGLEGMPKVSKGHLASESGGGGGWSHDTEKNPNLPRENFHPTVKPIKLMEYLIKLITPPNGIVLDPFMGSGSTGVASQNLKLEFLGIERDKQYFEIANKRINKKEINK